MKFESEVETIREAIREAIKNLRDFGETYHCEGTHAQADEAAQAFERIAAFLAQFPHEIRASWESMTASSAMRQRIEPTPSMIRWISERRFENKEGDK